MGAAGDRQGPPRPVAGLGGHAREPVVEPEPGAGHRHRRRRDRPVADHRRTRRAAQRGAPGGADGGHDGHDVAAGAGAARRHPGTGVRRRPVGLGDGVGPAGGGDRPRVARRAAGPPGDDRRPGPGSCSTSCRCAAAPASRCRCGNKRACNERRPDQARPEPLPTRTCPGRDGPRPVCGAGPARPWRAPRQATGGSWC